MEFPLLWAFFVILTLIIANKYYRSGCAWFILGCLFGPFALIVLLIMGKRKILITDVEIVGNDNKKCPYCAELIKIEAVKCKHCGSEIR